LIVSDAVSYKAPDPETDEQQSLGSTP
jgi:hypothetical protein